MKTNWPDKIREMLDEHARQRKKGLRQVSGTPKYRADLKKYLTNSEVNNKILEVENHFKNRRDPVLASRFNAHELDRDFKGFSSLSLYPDEYDKDVIILYRIHRDEHVTFYRIGNHEYVYSKNPKKKK